MSPTKTTGTLTLAGTEAGGAGTKTYTVGISVLKQAALSIAAGSGYSVAFPATAVGGMSAVQEFVVTNGSGTDYLTSGIVGVKVEGTGASQFLATSDCSRYAGLASAGTCKVSVYFMPTALTTNGDAVTATLTATNGGATAATLTIRGVPKAAMTISPTDGVIPTGATKTATQTFTITNDASASSTKMITTSITNPAEFILIDDQCYGVVLGGGDDCTITVKYIGPTTNTEKTAKLTVSGGSTAQSVSLDVKYTGAKAEAH